MEEKNVTSDPCEMQNIKDNKNYIYHFFTIIIVIASIFFGMATDNLTGAIFNTF